MATTIDHLGIAVLGNILARLPALDFASANAANSLFHHGCRHVLCCPKLSSACSHNSSLKVCVEQVVNKILSEPIRPNFAIVSVVSYWFDQQEAEKLIKAKLGSNFPIITNKSVGFMGRDALSQEFIKTSWEWDPLDQGIMLTVGYLPGMEVKKIPLVTQNDEQLPGAVMIDKFVTEIREFSASISGCNSPAAIIMFSLGCTVNTPVIMEKLDYEMSSKTVIVGDFGCTFNDALTDGGIAVSTAAIALVFVKDRNKPLGIGETQFHCLSSSGMLPLGPAYEMTSFEDTGFSYTTSFTAKKEGSHENVDCDIILKQAHDEEKNHGSYASLTARRKGAFDDFQGGRRWYIGVTKRRKPSIGQEKVELLTYFSFHKDVSSKARLYVDGSDLEQGDTFRFYLPDYATALSSGANVSNHLRSFKQGSTTTDDVKQQVFGGLIFTSYTDDELSVQASVDSSSVLDNFPGITLGVALCKSIIARRGLTTYWQEEKAEFSCVNDFGTAYLIMSYTP